MRNKKYSLILSLVSALTFTLNVNGKEAKKKETAFSVYTIQELNIQDPIGLKGYANINFFLYVPSSSKVTAKKSNELAVQELEKIGIVKHQSLDINNSIKEAGKSASFLKNPALTYRIEPVFDIHGKKLSLTSASLEFEAGATIAQTKEYCHPCFWYKKCYVPMDPDKNLERLIKETLSLLLKEFNQDYKEANTENALKTTFYYPSTTFEK